MKQDYTLDELQTEMTALAQLFDSVTLADPCMGLLDPATLQPLNKVAAMPALDAAGRGLKIEKAADGLRTVIAQGITVADTPCVLLLGMPRDLAEIEKESAAVTLADCRTGFFGTLYSAVLRLVAPLC